MTSPLPLPPQSLRPCLPAESLRVISINLSAHRHRPGHLSRHQGHSSRLKRRQTVEKRTFSDGVCPSVEATTLTSKQGTVLGGR